MSECDSYRAPAHSAVPYRGMGALGLSATGSSIGHQIGVSAAEKGASLAATAALEAAGVAAGALTAGIGLVVAFAVGKLLHKNYLNVPAMNRAEDQDVATFNQYLPIMGQAPGRAFGLQAMLAVFRGANHSGLFPKNNVRQCFHEGCGKYPGRMDWVNGFVNNPGEHGNINFYDALYRFKQSRNAADFGALAYAAHPTPHAVAASIPSGYPFAAQVPWGRFFPTPTAHATPTSRFTSAQRTALPTSAVSLPVQRALTPATSVPGTLPAWSSAWMSALSKMNFHMPTLRGLGQVAGASADAVNFVDNFLLPYNIAHSTWVVPQNQTEHQILYDVADAYLADKGIQSTPYIANPNPLVSNPPTAPVAPVAVPGNVAAVMMPNYSPVPVPASYQPTAAQFSPPVPVSAVPPPQTRIANFGTTLPYITGALPPPPNFNPTTGTVLPGAGALPGAYGGAGTPNFNITMPASNITLPSGYTPQAGAPVSTAGLSNLSPTLLAIVGALALVSFAMARPMPSSGAHRRRKRK